MISQDENSCVAWLYPGSASAGSPINIQPSANSPSSLPAHENGIWPVLTQAASQDMQHHEVQNSLLTLQK